MRTSRKAIRYTTINPVNILTDLSIDVEVRALSRGVEFYGHRARTVAVGHEPGDGGGAAGREGLSGGAADGDARAAA